ncbi:transmembrane protein 52B-like, partial [Hypanus sabinus]|uniref:transmembrane protein 52B-like n=1 Tax=Hypanus sabinus TaxID=79690 RepID=UPI0028C3B5D6
SKAPVYPSRFLLALSLSLVACGGALRCVRCCVRQGAEAGGRGSRPLEVTVITLEQDNTIHSSMQNTISSIQSLFLPNSRRLFTVTRCQNPLPGSEAPPCHENSPAAST